MKFVSNPPAVPTSALLQKVLEFGREALRVVSNSETDVLVFDMGDNSLSAHRIDALPKLFQMGQTFAWTETQPEVIFCDADFADFHTLKRTTHTNTTTRSGHVAAPIFIAPPHLHREHLSAVMAVVWWCNDSQFPETNAHLYSCK